MRVDFTSLGMDPTENGKTGRAGQTATAGSEPSRTSGTAGSTSGLDQTRFSFDQTRVQSLEARVLAQPDIREAKVQSLQHAIGNGGYSVPPSQVADALVSELGTGTDG